MLPDGWVFLADDLRRSDKRLAALRAVDVGRLDEAGQELHGYRLAEAEQTRRVALAALERIPDQIGYLRGRLGYPEARDALEELRAELAAFEVYRAEVGS